MKRIRKRPKKEAVRIQLFPFMDVFLCMMGALILMFIIIANGSRGLVATAAREGAAKEDDVKIDRENAEWKIKHLRTARDETAADLEQKRLELSHLEEHASRVRDQLAEMDRAAAELERKATGEDPTAEKLRAQLADVKSQLLQSKALLTEEDKKIKPQKDSFAIIPYEGPNQTRRRPIYIECRADGIFLQPEGVQLSPDVLSGVSGQGNPLASALRRPHASIWSAAAWPIPATTASRILCCWSGPTAWAITTWPARPCNPGPRISATNWSNRTGRSPTSRPIQIWPRRSTGPWPRPGIDRSSASALAAPGLLTPHREGEIPQSVGRRGPG